MGEQIFMKGKNIQKKWPLDGRKRVQGAIQTEASMLWRAKQRPGELDPITSRLKIVFLWGALRRRDEE